MKLNYRNAQQKDKVLTATDVIKQESETYFVGDEMLILNKNMHFMNDKKFASILNETATSDLYKGMAWRMHNLVYASKMALRVPGDFMECGVFRGFKSYFLLNYFKDTLADRNYYLCDTYAGIDEALADSSPISQQEHLKTRLHDFVKQRFKPFPNAKVVAGSVPQSLTNLKIDNIAFLHLDMNSYLAEIGALECLWDKIPKYGVIILDDFGLHSHRAQMEHELPWLQDKKQVLLEFPTGQAMIVKE